ncbi:hypothetical protein EBR21_10690 [bacterium]|nr:hypothetical protein [bacterium]
MTLAKPNGYAPSQNGKILTALSLLFVSLFGCNSRSRPAPGGDAIITAQHVALLQNGLEKKPDIVLQKLEGFVSSWTKNRDQTLADLQPRLEELLIELDNLAVPENVDSSFDILKRISETHAQSLEIAQEEANEELKGIWLNWTERLLLTRSALQHFFSESKLNEFERRLDRGLVDDAISFAPELSRILHPQHEARLISMYRAYSENSATTATLLSLIANSGGPLARLFLYQRFNTSPSLELAEAIAKARLPRTSDLLGENTFLGNGPFSLLMNLEDGNRTLDSIRDFPERWKDMKGYLESLQKIPERLERARNFWLEMHVKMEQSLSALPVEKEKKYELKAAILQSFSSGNPAEKNHYIRDGIEFKEGDIVLVQNGETGGLWESFTGSGSLLSHMQMVTFDERGLPYAIEMNYGRILLSPLDLNADRYVVVRLRNSSEVLLKRIHESFLKLKSQDIVYDFNFDSTDHRSLYCSELAAAVLEASEAGVIPFAFSPRSQRAGELLKKTGVRSQSFFGQGSYLGSPRFSFVAERIYADPNLLIKGQMILDGFNHHLANASEVLLRKHPDSHTIFGLAALAQTLGSDLRRGLGPQPFLFTVMVLDRLMHSIDNDVRNSPSFLNRSRNHLQSRITALKQSVSAALTDAIPNHLEVVFPASHP